MSTPIDSPSAAGHPAAVPAMGLVLDAQALYAELRRGVQALRTPQTRLVGIT